MKFLLDTHIWLWAVNQPDKLSRAVRRELQKSSNELYLSPVSIWEAHQLDSRGRIRLKPGFSQWIVQTLAETPLREAPLNFAVAIRSTQFELPQPDVGDTFIASTASVFDLTLITADSQLLACSWLKTLAND